jgi:putative flavoprotein involved in K+ transport
MVEQPLSADREASKGHLEEGTAFDRRSRARPRQERPERVDVVVIGGSQSGLAAGYHLKRHGIPFVILDAHPRIGGQWRSRWDSLRLFTPGRYDSLPGMTFPGRPWACPTKDEMADYLESYAERFQLPVRTGIEVTRVGPRDDGFEIVHRDGRLAADHVVVATGAWHHPRVPSFADLLDSDIRQMHPASIGGRRS